MNNPFSPAWLLDAAERVVMTYLQTFAGLLLVNGNDGIDLTTLHAAAVASVPAALAAAKAILVAGKGSASVLGPSAPVQVVATGDLTADAAAALSTPQDAAPAADAAAPIQ